MKAQNSEQQDKPREINRGSGVPQEVLDAYEARPGMLGVGAVLLYLLKWHPTMR